MLSRSRSLLQLTQRTAPSALNFRASAAGFKASAKVQQETTEVSSPSAAATQPEEQTAQNIIKSFPFQDKHYSVLMTTLVGTTLLAKEILPYTVDVIYVGLFSLVYYLGAKNVGGAISGLTDEVAKEEEKIWNDAKVKAEESLKMNIEQIAGSGASDLVKVTEQLYEDAKQLVQLEQKAVSHKHQLEYYTKAKQILDEWVRYETKQKESEKSYISDQVIKAVTEKITKDDKFQQKYLEQCIADVELAFSK
ncbi:hypothetical protein MP638_001385 [Amoeboaphelidium occidentale]|nr:hypothetical protein MP638_001385 [Amoeboaphelidium occidentale]